MFFGGAMLNFRKIISILLCIASLLVVGCKDKEQTSSPQNDDTVSQAPTQTVSEQINMIYSSKDTLNPYTCVTAQNKVITQLMFESLVIVGNNFKPEYNLAQNIEYNNRVCKIELISAAFSDATPVTATDVIFSFNLAKESAAYSSMLNYAVSAEATGTRTLTITLSRDDPYFINLLTFPIIKNGSDTLTDSDNRLLPPIGTGRYVFDTVEKNLKVNGKYHKNIPKILTVTLTDCPDDEATNQALSTGAVDIYFTDLENNIIPKMNGSAVDVILPRIVFLGVNPKSALVKNVYFRQAVSAALDRESICTSAYFSKATPAKGPFPTVLEEVANLQTTEQKPNLETVNANIELAGFKNKNKDGFYLLQNNEPITLTLLVSKDNSLRLAAANIIKKNLENAGFKIRIVSVSNKIFKTELSAGAYDIYLGEINMHNNLDLGALVSLNSAKLLLSKKSPIVTNNKDDKPVSSQPASSSSASNVTAQSLTTADIYKGFYSGKYTVEDLTSAFIAELPVIPVCYRNGLTIYSEKLGTGLRPTISDLFYDTENLK